MDREDIIRMAREAGLAYGSDERPLGSVTRFAALVAAAEREACVKLFKDKKGLWDSEGIVYTIRERSDK
jgi:hypothetical protein